MAGQPVDGLAGLFLISLLFTVGRIFVFRNVALRIDLPDDIVVHPGRDLVDGAYDDVVPLEIISYAGRVDSYILAEFGDRQVRFEDGFLQEVQQAVRRDFFQVSGISEVSADGRVHEESFDPSRHPAGVPEVAWRDLLLHEDGRNGFFLKLHREREPQRVEDFFGDGELAVVRCGVVPVQHIRRHVYHGGHLLGGQPVGMDDVEQEGQPSLPRAPLLLLQLARFLFPPDVFLSGLFIFGFFLFSYDFFFCHSVYFYLSQVTKFVRYEFISYFCKGNKGLLRSGFALLKFPQIALSLTS